MTLLRWYRLTCSYYYDRGIIQYIAVIHGSCSWLLLVLDSCDCLRGETGRDHHLDVPMMGTRNRLKLITFHWENTSIGGTPCVSHRRSVLKTVVNDRIFVGKTSYDLVGWPQIWLLGCLFPRCHHCTTVGFGWLLQWTSQRGYLDYMLHRL